MGIIKGQNLRLTLGGKYVAFATSCTVHVSAQLEDSSTKDTTGSWTSQEITGLSWDLSTDALFSVDTDATGVNAVDALDLILAQGTVQVTFTQAEGDKNRVPGSGAVSYSGTIIVNDVSITAGNRQNASYTLQGTGVGALVKDE